ncbi:MAG: hypothetical protein M3P40_04235 [Actinomycetota bacterium]|nr:hypothetical protein [Actinomycetota bacterium]
MQAFGDVISALKIRSGTAFRAALTTLLVLALVPVVNSYADDTDSDDETSASVIDDTAHKDKHRPGRNRTERDEDEMEADEPAPVGTVVPVPTQVVPLPEPSAEPTPDRSSTKPVVTPVPDATATTPSNSGTTTGGDSGTTTSSGTTTTTPAFDVGPQETTTTTPVRPRLLLLRPFPTVRIAGQVTRRGTVFRILRVKAPRTSRVLFTCRGQGCAGRRRATSANTAGMRRFRGLYKPGAVIEIRVTKRNRVGKYTRILVRRGRSPVRRDLCLYPGVKKPRSCPAR